MKVLKSYLNGAVVIGWQGGKVLLVIDGQVGGGKASGLVSGSAQLQLGVVDAVENLGEAELNSLIAAHEPAVLPFVQAIESFANSGLAQLG
jgi:hypothetical protein